MPELKDVREALLAFGADPAGVAPLARVLGFTPTPLPPDLLANRASPLAQAFESPRTTDRFGVEALHRVAAGPAAGSALYVAVLSDWGVRSSSRDRSRRRVARAVVENTADTRSLILLVPSAFERGAREEVEIVMPRLRERAGRSDISTVRALLDTADPSRFHLDLLVALAAAPGDTLVSLTARWRKAFSVERVTREFYTRYREVRDRLVAAMVASNAAHPWVQQMAAAPDGEARRREWATRQLGRLLFLWFLQSKRWLGYDGSGEGPNDYLLDLWRRRGESGASFWSGMLQPLFFKAMAETRPAAAVTTLVGNVPYLNGGLFRPSALEDEVDQAGGPLELPDAVFDPDAGALDQGQFTVLGLLSRYRFTTRESTPDDQSVDPDPELLGRVFENLYQDVERHGSGTYYTPREIVHFMCRQALDGYLRDTAEVDQDTLDWLRREVADPEDSDRTLTPDMRERLERALERVRICDPAVGSGAFLLGSMQEMVLLRKGMGHAAGDLDVDARVEEWKRHAIEHSLYGVDINPEAVEICQLRLWLSLVLDYRGHPREVRPLPNLDFRILVGDSLIDRFEEIAFVDSLPAGSYQAPMEIAGRLDSQHQDIERWQDEYLTAAPARQRDLRDQIRRAKLGIMRAQVEAQRTVAQEQVTAIPAQTAAGRARQTRAIQRAGERLHGYEAAIEELDVARAQRPRVEKPFLWPLAFPEVFEEGGFDIVLANPPYVRQEKLDASDQRVFHLSFPTVYASAADLLVFFYERTAQILRSGGHAALITSNKFTRADYGIGLRRLIGSRFALDQVVDFGHIPVFEADVYPIVLTMMASEPRSDSALTYTRLREPIRDAIVRGGESVNVETVRDQLTVLGESLVEHGQPVRQSDLQDEQWSFASPVGASVLATVASHSRRMSEVLGTATYWGIKTAYNPAYVLTTDEANSLIASGPAAETMIRPWARGQDIRRWRLSEPVRYLLLLQNSNDGDAISRQPWSSASSEAEAEARLSTTYPGIHHRMRQFEEGLRRRSDHGRFWWELRPCTYYAAFESPKVIWRDVSYLPAFAWDTTGSFGANSMFISASAPRWLVGYANSSLFAYLASFRLMEGKDAYFRWLPSDIGNLPVPDMDDAARGRLDELVGIAAVADGGALKAIESEVNALVFAAAGLNPEQVRAIEEWFSERQRTESKSTILEGKYTDDE